MYCINVVLTVKNAADVAQVTEMMIEMGRLSRSEPGCIRYEVCHSQTDATRYFLCERWETKAAWEHHRTLPPFKTIYEPRVIPLVNREPHACDLL